MILTDRLFEYRIDRLISACRIVLALASFAAIVIDNSQPRNLAQYAYWLLLGYAGFAVVLAVVTWKAPTLKHRLGLPAHVVDVMTFILLLYITEGTTSPHFPFFVFVLLSAALKWKARGALWTTAAMFLLFIPTGFGLYNSIFGSSLDIQRFIIRTCNLVVVGGILFFFGLENERMGRDLLKLGSFPQNDMQDSFAQGALQYTAGIFNVERVLLAWSDAEEPFLYIAELEHGKLRQKQEPPNRFSPMVAKPLRSNAFLLRENRDGALYLSPSGAVETWHGLAVHRDFLQEYRVGNALSVPLRSHTVEGRIFILGIPFISAENVAIAAAVASQIIAGVDRAAAKSARRKAEAAEQGLRLARDLHDGILQFLAGAGMQLEGIVQNLGKSDVGDTEERIGALQNAISIEQRDLRNFIQQLRPGFSHNLETISSLSTDLALLADRLSQQWGVNVRLRLEPTDVRLSSRLQYEVNQVVREAVANAVKHGRALGVDVDVAVSEGVLHLKIADDGCGLTEVGTFTTDQLEKQRLGPRSLRERIKSLHGTFTLKSDNTGIILETAIPLSTKSD